MILSHSRIAELASQPGVKRTVVENFLGTMHGLSRDEALANLDQDFVSYRWNTATGRAIRLGILEAVPG
jgi:hypothetical protein